MRSFLACHKCTPETTEAWGQFLRVGAQWLSGRVLDSRPRGRGFEPHRRHCVVSLSKNIYPSLVLVQPRKTRPFITERLLMGRKESNQTKQFLRPHSQWQKVSFVPNLKSKIPKFHPPTNYMYQYVYDLLNLCWNHAIIIHTSLNSMPATYHGRAK